MRLASGAQRTVQLAECGAVNAEPLDVAATGDLTDLLHVNEAAVLEQLRQRYFKGLIHSSVGQLLVVLNPYEVPAAALAAAW